MSSKRVLIVDDDEDICSNIKDILDDLGYQTDIAHDGPSALNLVDANCYDVALLDYSMPGMDGATLHQQMVQRRPEIAAIMVTAYAQGDGAQRARDGGIQQVLRKPVDLGELLPLVEQLSNSPIVLVVDDDAEFCKTLWHILRERSYRVCLAHDKEDGVRKAMNANYQIAVVDLSLSTGQTDGCDVLHRVSEVNPAIRTILITGHREEAKEVIDRCKASGLDDVCFKPLDIETLISKIELGRMNFGSTSPELFNRPNDL
ncbi:response regulator [Rhodopirellula bahusiensis]|uniref:Two-component system response regulator n=1 Tax=Rhodopirellula bahusiensis TaxID=2014065 RepID=A0A2G1VZP6_9BACT|nr:response regulator [Rhodopirellula bahusiensis]PHQ32252.1 two-component system response regulator [Rhodopirellula bahusiensis]